MRLETKPVHILTVATAPDSTKAICPFCGGCGKIHTVESGVVKSIQCRCQGGAAAPLVTK